MDKKIKIKGKIKKMLSIIFFTYLGISLILILIETFSSTDWYYASSQYSNFEIIIRCIFFVLVRACIE